MPDKVPTPVRILERFPFHFGRQWNPIAISQKDKLVQTGQQSPEDQIGDNVKITKIVFEIKGCIFTWNFEFENISAQKKEGWDNYLVFDTVIPVGKMNNTDAGSILVDVEDTIRVHGGIDLKHSHVSLDVVERKFKNLDPDTDVTPYYYELEIYRNTYPEPIVSDEALVSEVPTE